MEKSRTYLGLVDPDLLLFSFSSCLGAIAALGICLWASLPWPWLGVLMGYVTTQTMNGPTRPHLVHRLGGVLLGAAAAVAFVPTLQNSPALLVLALAAWTGIFIFLAVRERTPRAIFYQTAAFAGAIITFPNADIPADIFLTATWRVGEMTTGILCMTAAHALLRPFRIEMVLRRRARQVLNEAAQWTADALDERRHALVQAERLKLVADVAELSVLAGRMAHRQARAPSPRALAGMLHARIAVILAATSAASDRFERLAAHGATPAEVQALVLRTIASLSARTRDQVEAASVAFDARALARTLADRSEQDALLAANLCQRIAELAAAHGEAQHILAALDGRAGDLAIGPEPIRDAPIARHPAIPILAGLGTAAALGLICFFWVSTGWTGGAATTVYATLVGTSFNAQDDPTHSTVRYIRDLALTLPLVLFYLAVLLPTVDSYVMLSVLLAPTFLVLGYMQADPRRASTALAAMSCFVVGLYLTARYNYDLDVVLNRWLAQLGGGAATLIAAKLFRAVDVRWVASHLKRAQWFDLERLARSPRRPDHFHWRAHGVDRLGQIAARLAVIPDNDDLHATDSLGDLRAGFELIHLRSAREITPGAAGEALGDVLRTAHAWYRARRRGQLAPVEFHALVTAIDIAISALKDLSDPTLRRNARLALIGLRCDILPQVQQSLGPRMPAKAAA